MSPHLSGRSSWPRSGLLHHGLPPDPRARFFLDHAAVQMERCQHELAQFGRPVLAGQMIENTIHVGRGFFVGREVAQSVYSLAVRTL